MRACVILRQKKSKNDWKLLDDICGGRLLDIYNLTYNFRENVKLKYFNDLFTRDAQCAIIVTELYQQI